MPFPDVAVLLPGISGSVLAKGGKEIWGTSGQAIWKAVTSGGESVKTLALSSPDDWKLDDLGDGITAPGLVQDLHIIPGLWKIDGYSGLIARLQSALGLDLGQNLFPFPYDWRRDNRVSARRLQNLSHGWLKNWRERSGNEKAKLILVGHSMGGLVARYFLECLGGWKDTRALISFGTPYRGSLNALGYLVNGYAKGIGPLSVDLSNTVRSFTALYQLLPAFECIDMGDGKLQRIGEIKSSLPNVDSVRARQSLEFYREMRTAQEANAKLDDYARSKYEVFPIVGIGQPTFQSARLERGSITLLRAIRGKDDSGDGTVPRISAIPLELSSAHREIFVSEVHASLQNFDAALVQLTGILTGTQIDLAGFNFALQTISLDLDDVYAADAVTIRAEPSADVPVVARLVGTAPDAPVHEMPLVPVGDSYQGTTNLPPGPYRVTASALFAEGPISATDVILVVDQRS